MNKVPEGLSDTLEDDSVSSLETPMPNLQGQPKKSLEISPETKNSQLNAQIRTKMSFNSTLNFGKMKAKQSEQNLLIMLQSPGVKQQPETHDATKSVRKPPTLKRISSGINYFTGQMKFKPAEGSNSRSTTPAKTNNNKKVLNHQDTLQEFSDDELTESKASESNASNSENLETDKTPDADPGTGTFMIRNQMNIKLNHLSPQKVILALTGQENLVTGGDLQDQDSKIVQYGQAHGHNYADVYSPQGQKKIRVNFNEHQKVRIQSSLIKRLELEHIEHAIESLSIVPDFGFPVLNFEDQFKGWDLLRDHIQNGSKFERVNNFIDAQKYEFEMEQKKKFLEMSKEKKIQMIQQKQKAQMSNGEREMHKLSSKFEIKKKQIQKDLKDLQDAHLQAVKYLQRYQTNHQNQYKPKTPQISMEKSQKQYKLQKARLVKQNSGKGKLKVVGYKNLHSVDRQQSLLTDDFVEKVVPLMPDLDEIESFNSSELSAQEKLMEEENMNTLDETIIKGGLTNREIKLFRMLNENYVSTAQSLLKTCLAYDHFQMTQNSLPPGHEFAEDPKTGPKLLKQIDQLRNDKLSIGSLMRVVRSNNYQNITDDLSEIEQIKERMPKIVKFVQHMQVKRDLSRVNKEKSKLCDTPAQKMYRSPIMKKNKDKSDQNVDIESHLKDDRDITTPKFQLRAIQERPKTQITSSQTAETSEQMKMDIAQDYINDLYSKTQEGVQEETPVKVSSVINQSLTQNKLQEIKDTYKLLPFIKTRKRNKIGSFATYNINPSSNTGFASPVVQTTNTVRQSGGPLNLDVSQSNFNRSTAFGTEYKERCQMQRKTLNNPSVMDEYIIQNETNPSVQSMKQPPVTVRKLCSSMNNQKMMQIFQNKKQNRNKDYNMIRQNRKFLTQTVVIEPQAKTIEESELSSYNPYLARAKIILPKINVSTPNTQANSRGIRKQTSNSLVDQEYVSRAVMNLTEETLQTYS